MKIAFLTLGCKLNYAETSTYERGFKEAGLEVVPWQQKADIYLVNTCSVTATSDSKSRNLIRKVHRVNPSARIVVTGCSAQLRREEIERISGVTRVFGAEEKSLVVSETLHGGAVPGTDIPRVFGAYSTGERTRSFLKVQDGCNNFCKYCTVPYARGRSRNIPISECVENARKIASEGIKEIVLTGVNTGDFGRTTGESFLDLLKALNDVDGIERYRISSIEPNLITEEIVDWIASGTKFQPHFHIPLQTGADSQLEAMGRHYDTAFFRGRIDYIRSKMEAPGRPKVFRDRCDGRTSGRKRRTFPADQRVRRIRKAGVHPCIPLLQKAGNTCSVNAGTSERRGEKKQSGGSGRIVHQTPRRVRGGEQRRRRESAFRVRLQRRHDGRLYGQLYPRQKALRQIPCQHHSGHHPMTSPS